MKFEINNLVRETPTNCGTHYEKTSLAEMSITVDLSFQDEVILHDKIFALVEEFNKAIGDRKGTK